MQTLIELDHLTLKRGRRMVLEDLQLSLSRGEIVVLIGGNGAGKTTLLSIMAGLLKPSSGRIIFPNGSPRIGLVGDKPALYPDWNVGMFLNWCAEAQGANRIQVTAVIEQCGLLEVLTLPCRVLSHGYRQRVSLAQSLLTLPDVLLLDEPSNGLDPEQRYTLRGILQTVVAQTGILMICHDLDEMLAIADRVYDLRHGRCIEISLPPRTEKWLWCEWQTAEQANLEIQADARYGHYTGYQAENEATRQVVMTRLAAHDGVVALTSCYPVTAFQLQREAQWESI